MGPIPQESPHQMFGRTHLLAQMRAASKASELSCSYSLETKWMQRGNSSTVARFRPRSKIRILNCMSARVSRAILEQARSLRVRHTTVEPGLGIWLENSISISKFAQLSRRNAERLLWRLFFRESFPALKPSPTHLILAVTVTSRWATGHLE